MTSCTSSPENGERRAEAAPVLSARDSTRESARNRARHGLYVALFYALLFTAFFSPVLFSDDLLAPGDGLIYYLPNFYSAKSFWDDTTLLGFPMTADPQVMSWYPLSLFFSPLPAGWNIFVVSAYVLAGCFTYGYVYSVTGCRLAGAVGGVTYAMGGFMVAHLGHVTMIHSALWLPLVVWALEELRRRLSGWWLLVCSLAVACCALAGHAQVLVYTLLLGGVYVIVNGWRAPIGRWRYYGASLLAVFIGLGLSALQTLPAAELSGLTPRSGLAFSDFVVHFLPLSQTPMLLFPALFGSNPGFGTPYFGEPNLTELTGYVGLLPLMLAGVGVVVFRRSLLVWFWLGVALTAFLLALGAATPLAYVAYHVPVVNLFRMPSRHLLEVSFAVSVLSGMGVAAVRRGTAAGDLITKVACVVAALMLLCLAFFAVYPEHLGGLAAGRDAGRVSLRPWVNPAVGVPLLVAALAWFVLVYYRQQRHSAMRVGLLVAVLVADLASFGWLYEWHFRAPPAEEISPPSFAQKYREELTATHSRLLSARGGLGAKDELPPTRSRLWNIPGAGGYGPLIPTRISRLFDMPTNGVVTNPWRQVSDRSLDLGAVRYFFLPRDEVMTDRHGTAWLTEDMDISLGSGCITAHPDDLRFDLPAPIGATELKVVSMLSCSTHVPDETEVLRISLTDAGGNVGTHSLLAGRDTAEWVIDCSQVRPHTKHRRAEIFQSAPAAGDPQPCDWHAYITKIPFGREVAVKSVALQWVGPPGAKITVNKMTFTDEATGRAHPVNLSSPSSTDKERWRHVEDVGRASVYENLRAMPRAWLAHEALTVESEEALRIIKSSRLPDGRTYDPSRTALVEESGLHVAGAEQGGRARVARLSGGLMEVHTSSASAAILVTSDAYYPGWRATIDGSPAPVVRANYALRAVAVPAGEHTVRFVFRPERFYVGVVVSSASVLILIFLVAVLGRRRDKRFD